MPKRSRREAVQPFCVRNGWTHRRDRPCMGALNPNVRFFVAYATKSCTYGERGSGKGRTVGDKEKLVRNETQAESLPSFGTSASWSGYEMKGKDCFRPR